MPKAKDPHYVAANCVQKQIRLTPEQLTVLKVQAAKEGKTLIELYNRAVARELKQREEDRKTGLRAAVRYAAHPNDAKAHNAMFDEDLIARVEAAVEEDGSTPTRFLYTALAKAALEATEAENQEKAPKRGRA